MISTELRCTFLAGVAVSTATNVLTGLSGAGASGYRLGAMALFFLCAFLLLQVAISASEVAHTQQVRGVTSPEEVRKALRTGGVRRREGIGWLIGVVGIGLLLLDLVVQ